MEIKQSPKTIVKLKQKIATLRIYSAQKVLSETTLLKICLLTILKNNEYLDKNNKEEAQKALTNFDEVKAKLMMEYAKRNNIDVKTNPSYLTKEFLSQNIEASVKNDSILDLKLKNIKEELQQISEEQDFKKKNRK